MTTRTHSYRDLLVWQKSLEVAEQVFALADVLVRPKWFAMADQLRRSAISVPSNIAEGQGRRTRGEFIRFLAIANGSLRELETQLILLARLDKEFAPGAEGILRVADEVSRMLNGLHHSVRSSQHKLHY